MATSKSLRLVLHVSSHWDEPGLDKLYAIDAASQYFGICSPRAECKRQAEGGPALAANAQPSWRATGAVRWDWMRWDWPYVYTQARASTAASGDVCVCVRACGAWACGQLESWVWFGR